MLLALAAGAAPAPASAGVALPDPRNTIVPSHLTVAACGIAGPDSVAGRFRIQCLDLFFNPIANARIVVDFSGCADVRLAEDQLDPRLVTNCPLHYVAGLTDAAGDVWFTVLGAGTDAPPAAPQSVVVYADGVRVGRMTAAVLDRDGVDGLSPGDLSRWAADYFGGTHPPRADFDGDGAVTPADLSIWAERWASGREVFSAGPWCR